VRVGTDVLERWLGWAQRPGGEAFPGTSGAGQQPRNAGEQLVAELREAWLASLREDPRGPDPR
jgi:hypothetical protein